MRFLTSTPSPHPANRVAKRALTGLAPLVLAAGLLVGATDARAAAAATVGAPTTVGSPATADRDGTTSAPRAGGGPARVASGRVEFDLVNTNNSSVLCLPSPDGRAYPVQGRLVGPRSVLSGRAAVVSVNVLVHDAGTGGWFFHLRGNPTYDYATQLAKRGHTSLVLDRLGYDSSPLGNGDDTCLGAQVHMLHQVVQHLYGGRYDYVGPRSESNPPPASQVVLQGHGTGATLVQLEAARFDDVAGVVLMAPATSTPSQLALGVAGAQLQTCARAGYAAYGASAREYRRLLFRTAPRDVRAAAVRLRNPTPCGDVASLPGALASITLAEREVEKPVLLLQAGADARTSGGDASVTSTERITRRTVRGAGSALTLERSAPSTQRLVARWLDRL